MSLLRAAKSSISSPPGRTTLYTAFVVRAQSTVTPSHTAVETSDKQATDISTTIPSKEAVTADIISGAPCELYA